MDNGSFIDQLPECKEAEIGRRQINQGWRTRHRRADADRGGRGLGARRVEHLSMKLRAQVIHETQIAKAKQPVAKDRLT